MPFPMRHQSSRESSWGRQLRVWGTNVKAIRSFHPTAHARYLNRQINWLSSSPYVSPSLHVFSIFPNPISNQDSYTRCCIRRFCRTPSKRVMESIRDLANKRSVSDLDPKLKQRVLPPLRSDSRQGILGMTRGPTEELIFCLEMDNIYFIFLRLLFFLWSLLFFGCWCLLNFSCAPILAPNGEWVQWRRFFWLSHYVKGEARAGRIGFSVNSDCL